MASHFKTAIKSLVYKGAPGELSKKFSVLTDEESISLREILMPKNGNNGGAEITEEELNEHLVKRIAKFRNKVIPWINNLYPLQNATVLEIGCGTGSSTVALAEQGAKVYAIDINDASLQVAHRRLQLYKQEATLIPCNAMEIKSKLGHISFDCIIFFATLEHLINEERIAALRMAWDMLDKGRILCVIEAPNRLWHHDFHTSLLPFNMWLPDDLAYQYARFSKREKFRELYSDNPPGNMLGFLRRGRGVSYHEFDVAIENFDHSQVISSLEEFSKRKFIGAIYDRFRHRHYCAFKNILKKVGPKIHTGFYEPWLDILIRKH